MGARQFTFTHDGHTFRCRVDMVGDTAGGLSRPSNAVWRVEVDGALHAPLDAMPDDDLAEVQRRITEWFDATHG
ncbi:MAG TPA: hypothetical protein VD793_00050 [Gemmatimonadales bacterium]|nr:hypothetical protein [Gemmatimonadales bacterium]